MCYNMHVSDCGFYALKGKRGAEMATSSITASFHTDDPKAANAIVHALFTVSKGSRLAGSDLITRALDEFRMVKSRVGGKLVMVERESDRPKLLNFCKKNGFKSWTSRTDAQDGVTYDQMFAVLNDETT